MSPDDDWLPPLITLDASDGDWNKYEAKLYGEFYRDFLANRPRFRGESVVVIKRYVDSKEACFWHCTSEGAVEQNRTPDLRRCERIAWIRKVIEAAGTPTVRWWLKKQGPLPRALVAVADFSYVVVLEKRKGRTADYWVLITAYPVEQVHRRRKMQREYEQTPATEKG